MNCIPSQILSAAYTGGNEDGSTIANYLSTYKCTIPVAAAPPYIGGYDDGYSNGTWTGVTCGGYTASAIYYGGYDDGYAYNKYLSSVICTTPVAAGPPYIGGNYAGSAVGTYLSSQTCNLIISDIYHGGNGQGYGIYNLLTTMSSLAVNISTPSTFVCPNSNVAFTAHPVVGAPPYSYNWFVNGHPTGVTTSTFSTSTLSDGDQVYTVMGAMACTSMAYATSNVITINHIPAASIPVFVAGADTLCAGQPSTYQATAINTYGISYSIVSGSATINANTGVLSSPYSDFIVRATANNVCPNGSAYQDYAVKVIPYPVLSITADTTICYGASIPLNVSGADSYLWNYLPSLSDTTIPNPVATPLSNSTYVVTGTTWTCSSTESVNVDVSYCDQVWTGLVDDDWHNPGNWSLVVPIPQTNAVIPTYPAGGNIFPVANYDAECKSMLIEPNASVTINSGNNLYVYENWTNNGVPVVGDGTVYFTGDVNQIVNGATTFGNITVNFGSTVTMASAGQKVKKVLLCNGLLYSNGNMTLVSDASGTGLISGSGIGQVYGTVTQQRFVPSSKAKGYKHFATAFSNSTFAQFSNFMTLYLGNVNNSPYPTLFKYSESDATPYFSNGWVAAAPKGQVNNLIEVGIGYTAQFGATSQGDKTAYMFGQVNNGNITKIITRLNPGSSKGDGWNLLGNPYPSPIDLDKLNYNAAEINKSVAIFISTSMYYGYYGYYNAANHMELNGGTRHIGALNAFFVQRKVDGVGTFTFTNSMRSDIVNPAPYKEDAVPYYPVIKLAAGLDSPDMIQDETVITFHNDANDNLDADYDIGKLWNTDNTIPNLYSISNNNKLAMNGLPEPQDNTVIPLGFKAPVNGNYIIKSQELLNIDKNVWLEDVEKGTLTNLKNESVYHFYINADDPAEGRFFLRFGETTAAGTTVSSDNNSFSCWAFGEQIVISYNASEGNNAKVELFDSIGRKIYQKNNITPGMHQIKPNVAPGVYMLIFTYPEGNKTVRLYIE